MALLAASIVPAIAATPTCSSLDRVVPAAGAAVKVHTESCADTQVYAPWTYRSWYNTTTVQVANLQGETFTIYDTSAHYASTNGVDAYDQYAHNYGATLYDGVSSYQSAGASNNQYTSTGYGCQESTSVGTYDQSDSTAGGVSRVFYGGDDARYVLPCTTSDVQQTLP
jgi:hypothetical protein